MRSSQAQTLSLVPKLREWGWCLGPECSSIMGRTDTKRITDNSLMKAMPWAQTKGDDSFSRRSEGVGEGNSMSAGVLGGREKGGGIRGKNSRSTGMRHRTKWGRRILHGRRGDKGRQGPLRHGKVRDPPASDSSRRPLKDPLWIGEMPGQDIGWATGGAAHSPPPSSVLLGCGSQVHRSCPFQPPRQMGPWLLPGWP